MESRTLEVSMFREFSLHFGGASVNDGSSRAKKIWLLLAYLIYNRTRPIPLNEMADLLWTEEEVGSNPLNALKTMLHRVRAIVEPLTDGGRIQFILRQDAAYAWNPEISIRLDAEEFERLCLMADQSADPEEKIALCRRALALCPGNFLPKLSSEHWVVPLAAHYHNLYVHTLLELLPLLEEQDRWEDCAQLCQAAVDRDPCAEELYIHLMRALLRLGRQQEAVSIYESASDLFLRDFGVMPSDALRALYREAQRSTNQHTVAVGTVLDQLREPPDDGGALVCEYDVFQNIYHSLARSILRSGDAIHLALISLQGQKGSPLSRRSLDRAIDNLRELLRRSLRRGDVAARCSVSQFILLLPQANYENSCMVCDRLVRSFARQYPHSPVALHVSICPLEPNGSLK